MLFVLLVQNFSKFRKFLDGHPISRPLPDLLIGDLPLCDEATIEGTFITAHHLFMPTLSDLGYPTETQDPRGCFTFKGGEKEGLFRCKYYMQNGVKDYIDTRNWIMGADYSSKLSPWLALGALSPRYVFYKANNSQMMHKDTLNSVKHFQMHLIVRDFARFWALKNGDKIFYEYGALNKIDEVGPWEVDKEVIGRWRQGQTGMPIIDAFMRQLNSTGYMSNRGRQIVANYLTLDLKQDWRYGAHYFEEKLIDHDVHSNYLGWSASSGIGPSKTLLFNCVKQSKEYDRDGIFILIWVTELQNVPTEYIHEPWNIPLDLQYGLNILIGRDYPEPIACEKYTDPVNWKAKFTSKTL